MCFAKIEKWSQKGGFKCFKCLKHYKNFGYGARKKWIKNDSTTWGGEKIFLKNGLQKILPPLLFPLSRTFAKFLKKKKWVILKNAAIQKHCREYFKNDSWDWKLEACSWKRHTMCWNWAAWGKKPKRCFHKASRSCKNVQSKTGLKVSNGDSLIRSRQRGRKEEGLVD